MLILVIINLYHQCHQNHHVDIGDHHGGSGDHGDIGDNNRKTPGT